MIRKRKPIASSKYYFFDVGVAGALQGRTFKPGTPGYGEAFETYLMVLQAVLRPIYGSWSMSIMKKSEVKHGEDRLRR
jgi:hypothetical protein